MNISGDFVNEFLCSWFRCTSRLSCHFCVYISMCSLCVCVCMCFFVCRYVFLHVHSLINIYVHIFSRIQVVLLRSYFVMSFYRLSIFCQKSLNTFWGCPRGVMVKALDCGIVVREFVLQFTFGQIPLGKMSPLILPAMG